MIGNSGFSKIVKSFFNPFSQSQFSFVIHVPLNVHVSHSLLHLPSFPPNLLVCGALDGDGNDGCKPETLMLPIEKGRQPVHGTAWHTHNPTSLVPILHVPFFHSNLLARWNSSFPAGGNSILRLSLCETTSYRSKRCLPFSSCQARPKVNDHVFISRK